MLVGRDTRESGDWIEQALARGVASQGAQLVSTGIVPTPAVAYLTGSRDFDAGSSSRPRTIRFRTTASRCSPATAEVRRGAASATSRRWSPIPASPSISTRRRRSTREDLVDAYLDHARAMLPSPAPLRGARIGLDCANGATTTVAPRLFRELGFDVRRDRRRAGRPQHQPRLRLDASGGARRRWCEQEKLPLRHRVRRRRRSRHPRSIADGRVVDGDAVLLPLRQAHAGRRPPQGRHRRRHRDEQHRPRDRAARGSASACCAARSATST